MYYVYIKGPGPWCVEIEDEIGNKWRNFKKYALATGAQELYVKVKAAIKGGAGPEQSRKWMKIQEGGEPSWKTVADRLAEALNEEVELSGSYDCQCTEAYRCTGCRTEDAIDLYENVKFGTVSQDEPESESA